MPLYVTQIAERTFANIWHLSSSSARNIQGNSLSVPSPGYVLIADKKTTLKGPGSVKNRQEALQSQVSSQSNIIFARVYGMMEKQYISVVDSIKEDFTQLAEFFSHRVPTRPHRIL